MASSTSRGINSISTSTSTDSKQYGRSGWCLCCCLLSDWQSDALLKSCRGGKSHSSNVLGPASFAPEKVEAACLIFHGEPMLSFPCYAC